MKNVNFERIFYPLNDFKFKFSFEYNDEKKVFYIDNDIEAYDLFNTYLKEKKESNSSISKFKKDLMLKYGIEIDF